MESESECLFPKLDRCEVNERGFLLRDFVLAQESFFF